MIFDHSPKTYKRLSQGLAVMAVVCTIGIGLKVIKRDYTIKRRIPLTVAAASLSLLYNIQYKRLENKFGEENNDSK